MTEKDIKRRYHLIMHKINMAGMPETPLELYVFKENIARLEELRDAARGQNGLIGFASEINTIIRNLTENVDFYLERKEG